jgi:hypothetical protein
MKKYYLLPFFAAILVLVSCKKEEVTPEVNEPKLIFLLDFDSTQVRLNNIGQTSTIPSGHATQSPKMNKMSAHYIELAQSALTQIGSGVVVYHAPETSIGGGLAIDFSKAILVGKGGKFFEIPLKNVAVGEYEYLRVSIGYQNFDVKLHVDTTVNVAGIGNVNIVQDYPSTIASFVGFNSYITNFLIKTDNIVVNANKSQGFWGFEMKGNYNGYPINYTGTGQAPAGATTVVNPIASTSPNPVGSCLVTGPFNGGKLKITGKETKDIVVRVSMSTNQSFEWIDGNANGKWEPSKGESVVDMGLRGMIPFVQY